MNKEVKRPRDANQLGKFIVDVATGEREDSTTVDAVTAFTQTNDRKKGGLHEQPS